MADMIDENKLKELRLLHNTRLPNEIQNSLGFNMFKVAFPEEELSNGFGFVFFTKPDLNIFNVSSGTNVSNTSIKERPEFSNTIKSKPYLYNELQMNQSNGPFIYTLSNTVRNFPITDEIIKTRDSAETFNDWRVVYGHRINDSRTANTIDLTFRDNRSLDVYDTIRIWVNYIDLVTKGIIEPTEYNKRKRILDYAGSIYYIFTDETMINIKYFCKLIGTFPLNIPSSNFSWDAGNFRSLEYSVTFQYSFKDERISVIKDFNKICGSDRSRYIPLLTNEGIAPSTWATNVFIEETADNKFKLRFN